MENDKLVRLSDVIETVENQCSDGNMWGNENLTLIDACKTIDELSAIPAVDAVEVDRERLLSILRSYFNIEDSYTFELTRVKEAFAIGTMTFDDFVEWDEDNIDDLCDYIMKHCGARMDGEDGDA